MKQLNEISGEEIRNIIPILKEILVKQSPLFSSDLKLRLQQEVELQGLSYRVTDCRIRKMINYLRTNTILPVIGNRSGYKVAKTDEEIVEQAISLKVRAKSIEGAANGMLKFIG